MRRVGRLLPALLVCAAWPCLLRAQAPDLDEVLARAMEYLSRYEAELETVIADEKSTQETLAVSRGIGTADAPGRTGSGTGVPRTVRSRELVSEFLLVAIPGAESGHWVGFRNVLRVNRRALEEFAELFDPRLFKRSPREAVAQWKRLHAAGAKHYVGAEAAATNTLTAGLQVLRAEHQPRFNFRVDQARDRVEGIDTTVLEYDEFSTPTLIEDPTGKPIFTSGRVWVVPTDGRVLRTELITRPEHKGRRIAQITVWFGHDARLGTLVPVRMDEEYFTPALTLRGSARYSNYRRFPDEVEGGKGEK